MIDKTLIPHIQMAYQQLEAKQQEIIDALRLQGAAVQSGWYNGHYRKNKAGEWERDAYPIPVITVIGNCDVELSFDGISISVKQKQADALGYSFEKLAAYDFEAYGIENYLLDLYRRKEPIQNLINRIRSCDETEIGFSFSFSFETTGKQLADFILWLRHEGFYH